VVNERSGIIREENQVNKLPRLASGVLVALCAWTMVGCSKQPLETVAGRPKSSAPKVESQRPAADAAKDEKEIRALFERLWEHFARAEGDKAVALMDQATLSWYDQIGKDALTLTRSEFDKQNLQRRLAILQFRIEFDRATLGRNIGRALLARGISNGWLRKAAETKLALGYIGSNGKSAHAMLATAPDVPAFFFEKEADGWKYNEVRQHEYVLIQLKNMQTALNLEESRFLLSKLGDISKKQIDQRILDGPLEKLPG
jgi:hypothetical protein